MSVASPISRLPAEILCIIFMICRVHSDRIDWDWITITHVCSLWYSTALDYHALWSKPDFRKPKWAYEMIERSKKAPLTIEFNLHSSQYLSHIVGDTIEEVHLSAPPGQMYILLYQTNQHPAPILHTLVLNCGSDSCSLSVDFLRCNAPRLLHVELTHCHLRWDSPLLCNLVVLKMRHPGPPAPTLDQFISVLAAMPQLEVLDLEDTLPEYPHTNSTEKPHVDLPCLRELHVVGTLEESVIFSDHISIPPSCKATIHIKDVYSHPPWSCSETLGLINQVLERLPVVCRTHNTGTTSGTGIPLIKSLMVDLLDVVDIHAWDSDSGSLDFLSLAELQPGIFRLEVDLDADTDQVNELVDAICGSLPLAQLYSLHVINAYPDLDAMLFKTFGVLPNVNTLTIDGNSAAELVDALSPHSAVHGPSSDGTSTSTHAMLLTIMEADFDRDTLLTSLKNCLMYRKELEHAIHKLVLQDCINLISTEVEELKEFIDVNWDGSHYFNDRDSDDDGNSMNSDNDSAYGGWQESWAGWD
ncbi:hypothetical protein BT96DRAFT_912306 [Gymnopus androsaceus JB14]|uniref:Uncharacterized protein n=1 Tax=Gymnopus androsaceus JB14 TaxID=1447944 RepID=A0A6A4IR17_9AGAR|nr:hypothetical protein BT96DRAFT_912306 [Gymnopus androsaceus JB14]